MNNLDLLVQFLHQTFHYGSNLIYHNALPSPVCIKRTAYLSLCAQYSLACRGLFQLVWGDTFLVGCGYSHYYDPSRGYTKLYVCNYGPG